MRIARARISTPDHDQLRVNQIHRVTRQHVTKYSLPSRRTRSCADGVLNLGATQPLKQVRHQTLLIDTSR